jgi:hypothetical protein
VQKLTKATQQAEHVNALAICSNHFFHAVAVLRAAASSCSSNALQRDHLSGLFGWHFAYSHHKIIHDGARALQEVLQPVRTVRARKASKPFCLGVSLL